MNNKKVILSLLLLWPLTSVADWSGVVGAGRSSFAWCGPSGCWHQEGLPYSDDRHPTTYLFGLRDDLDQTFAVDVLYHHFDPIRVSGTYVPDINYNPVTRQITPPTKTWAKNGQASLITKTNGISLSVVPHTTFHGIDLSGRLGLFLYRQSTDFTYSPDTYASLDETGFGTTELIGFGVGHSFKQVSLSLETFAFHKVKYKESPVGGGVGCGHTFGLVSYMLTARFKL